MECLALSVHNRKDIFLTSCAFVPFHLLFYNYATLTCFQTLVPPPAPHERTRGRKIMYIYPTSSCFVFSKYIPSLVSPLCHLLSRPLLCIVTLVLSILMFLLSHPFLCISPFVSSFTTYNTSHFVLSYASPLSSFLCISPFASSFIMYSTSRLILSYFSPVSSFLVYTTSCFVLYYV